MRRGLASQGAYISQNPSLPGSNLRERVSQNIDLTLILTLALRRARCEFWGSRQEHIGVHLITLE